MRKVILGIDIDGVFNVIDMDDVPNDINKTPVKYLNGILEAVPSCDVLIVSSWGNRDNHTVECLVEAEFKYPNRVVGCTDNILDSRTEATHLWMNKHKEYCDIVCLDDEIALYDYSGNENKNGASKRDVVECRPDRGLDIDKAYETICRLQGVNLRFWS